MTGDSLMKTDAGRMAQGSRAIEESLPGLRLGK